MAHAGAAMQPGLVLDQKYKIARHLADGGMGAIYEAEHLTIGRRVAVKVLHPELSRNPDIVARFQQEARAASAIGHQNIVDILDLGRAPDGHYFLVMELLKGMNLAARLAQLGGRMPVPRAAHVMRQVLEALAATHKQGIVHRDLKPENVFLIQRGNDPDFVKVLDFGISKVLTDDLPKMSTTGQVLGTPYFMSPEQTRGAGTDHRVDIYACGAMLYQLVTGRLPFTAANFNALMFEIAGGRYYPPRAIVPDIPQAFEQVIQYAMALDPAYRYQTAEHMAQAILPFAKAETTGAEEGYDSRTPSALNAFVPPPPDLGVATGAVPPPAGQPHQTASRTSHVAPTSRGRALPITIGAGIAVGVCAGLIVIRQMDKKRVASAAPTAAKQPVATAPAPAKEPTVAPPAPVVGPVVDAGAVVVAEVAPDAAPAKMEMEMTIGAPAPPKEPVKEPVKEVKKEAVKEPVKEPIKEVKAPDPVKPPPAAPVEAVLTIRVTPADAPELAITVDGAAASGAITLPTKKKVKVVVKAKGYNTFEKRVTLTGDQTLDVKLTRKAPAAGPGGALGL